MGCGWNIQRDILMWNIYITAAYDFISGLILMKVFPSFYNSHTTDEDNMFVISDELPKLLWDI